jgi:hypothetical protein
MPVAVIFGLILFITLMSFVAIFPSGFLFIYHIWLRRNGLTTYKHIVSLRKEKYRKRSKDMQKKKRMNNHGGSSK